MVPQRVHHFQGDPVEGEQMNKRKSGVIEGPDNGLMVVAIRMLIAVLGAMPHKQLATVQSVLLRECFGQGGCYYDSRKERFICEVDRVVQRKEEQNGL